jgi:hypothetical protein
MRSRKRVHKEEHGKRRSSVCRLLQIDMGKHRPGIAMAFGIVRDTARALSGCRKDFKLTSTARYQCTPHGGK